MPTDRLRTAGRTMDRHAFLAALHRQLRPRTYLEIGVQDGASLALSRVPSIGIDPAFEIRHELQADIHLARTSSDEFFARDRPLAHLPIDVVDLAFIDGMHLAEYVVRDYLAVERFTTPATVVVLDDMLPRDAPEASRVRTTRAWTGDVYKAADALREHRPDLTVLEVDTMPTGVVVVLGPDADRGGVMPEYDEWLEQALVADPQQVPAQVLGRTRAKDPRELLDHPVWASLADARDQPTDAMRSTADRAVMGLRRTA